LSSGADDSPACSAVLSLRVRINYRALHFFSALGIYGMTNAAPSAVAAAVRRHRHEQAVSVVDKLNIADDKAVIYDYVRRRLQRRRAVLEYGSKFYSKFHFGSSLYLCVF
jgi:predicted transcriptional regulator of viral defense system